MIILFRLYDIALRQWCKIIKYIYLPKCCL